MRFILREFPLDTLAAGAAMLARCAGGDSTHAMIGVLFKTQEKWAFVRGSAVPELFKLAQQAGFTQERFDTCLNDKATLELIVAARDRRGRISRQLEATFFINGKRSRAHGYDESFDQAIAPLLNG